MVHTVVVVPTRRTPLPNWVIDRRRELGETIAYHRRKTGLSQDQLADHIGMERRSIQRYERGERDPTYSHLLLIANVLDIDVTDLVKRTPAGS